MVNVTIATPVGGMPWYLAGSGGGGQWLEVAAPDAASRFLLAWRAA
jgi:hypothetical protein